MPQAQHPTIHKGNFIALFLQQIPVPQKFTINSHWQEREKDKEMFIALETLALPSRLLNDPRVGVSPSTGGRIKHVLNVDSTVAADKPMRSRQWRLQARAGGEVQTCSLKQSLLTTDSVNFTLPLSQITNAPRGIWVGIKMTKMPKGKWYLKFEKREETNPESWECFPLSLGHT